MLTSKKRSENIPVGTGTETSGTKAKARVVRPPQVYLVTHSYTCSHLYDSEVTTDQVGAYYSEHNAVLGAVAFIEKEFNVTFHDKDTWETDNDTNEEDADDCSEEETYSIREFNESNEWSTEVETEGSDEHFVRIEPLTMNDA